MISTRKELKFYLQADLMMNRGYFKRPLLRWLYELWIPDEVMDYLCYMRKYAFYSYLTSFPKTIFHRILRLFIFPLQLYYKRRYLMMGNKLGISIGADCFGYGLVIHHPGSIVCGPSNKIGNYANISTSTCIIDRNCIIGNFLFMGTGAVVADKLSLGDNVWIGANSVLKKSFPQGRALITGIPGSKIRDVNAFWFEEIYANRWKKRYEDVEKLKETMLLT